jgi:hypothetical protein
LRIRGFKKKIKVERNQSLHLTRAPTGEPAGNKDETQFVPLGYTSIHRREKVNKGKKKETAEMRQWTRRWIRQEFVAIYTARVPKYLLAREKQSNAFFSREKKGYS